MRIQSTTAESWKPAVQLALAFAAIKFAIEFIGNLLAQHFGYGIFRDEMYYIVCGRHLAWGYVDQAPMVALQARIAEMLFGFRHLALFRSFSALAGAVKVFLTGILAWQLGGRRIAQVMAMIAVLIAPVYLGIDSFLSMNSFEPVFWMGCMVVVLLMVAGNSPKWWITFRHPWRHGSAEQAIHGVFPCRPADRSSTHSSTADSLEPMDTCSCRLSSSSSRCRICFGRFIINGRRWFGSTT